jgi:6-phosphogluconolactonase (cycloisomerase 2 family)
MAGVENIAPQGFAADSRRVVVMANEPGHQPRAYAFEPASGKLQPLTPEGVRASVTADGKFLLARPDNSAPQILPLEGGSPIREIKGLQEKDRPIQITADGAAIYVANYNGMSAAIYRVRVDTGARQLVKTLEMHDPAGGFGLTRVVTTPDAQYFAYNTLRQLSELYLLQGLN